MIKNIQAKLCEIGRIKTGKLGQERKTKDGSSTYRLPTRLNHFQVTTNERDETGNFAPNIPLMEKIAGQTGEDPGHLTTIPVVLLYDNIDDNFYTTYAAYKGKTLMCMGDGEQAIVRATGEGKVCPCERLEQDYKGPVKCKIFGRLQVVIQDMDIIGGVWSLRTTSWNSVQDLLGSMILIKRIAGRLAGIPLMLKLTPKTVAIATGQSTIYTTTLLYQGSPKALINAAGNVPMLDHDQDTILDQTLTPEEEDEVADEFYPPTDAEENAAADITEQAKGKKTRGRGKTKPGKEKTAADLAKETKKESPEDIEAALDKAEKAAAAEKAQEPSKEKAPAKAQTEPEKEEPPAGGQEEEPPVTEEEPIADEEVSDFGWV